MQTMSQPIMTLIYNEDTVTSDGGKAAVGSLLIAEFITGNLSVMSKVNILSVPLSHHNSMITCQSNLVSPKYSRITVAGACMHAFYYAFKFHTFRCSEFST